MTTTRSGSSSASISSGALAASRSTAVPGLAAKDVIDVQITVASLDNNDAVSRLQQAGYVFRQEITRDNLVNMPDTSSQLAKRFFNQQPGNRASNIHVREHARLNQLYPLLFRDYLRTDADTRMAYEQIKRELAKRFADDVSAYYAIKDPYMDTVFRAALLWRDQTRWQPDNSFV